MVKCESNTERKRIKYSKKDKNGEKVNREEKKSKKKEKIGNKYTNFDRFFEYL
jgi:hypothetical protein